MVLWFSPATVPREFFDVETRGSHFESAGAHARDITRNPDREKERSAFSTVGGGGVVTTVVPSAVAAAAMVVTKGVLL